MQLPKSFTKVTPLSKILAISLFVSLPFIGLFLGVKYQKSLVNDCNQALILTPPIVSETVSSSVFNPVLISTKNYQGKSLGIFSYVPENDKNLIFYRNYFIAVVENSKPIINFIPGYINLSLAEGRNVQSCQDCFDVVDDKIIVIDGEKNTVSIYQGLLDDKRNYFTLIKTVALPDKINESGNLISVKCLDNLCKLIVLNGGSTGCDFDLNLTTYKFQNISCINSGPGNFNFQ
jgi:hypothetical protein